MLASVDRSLLIRGFVEDLAEAASGCFGAAIGQFIPNNLALVSAE